jgi:hypothetical protein
MAQQPNEYSALWKRVEQSSVDFLFQFVAVGTSETNRYKPAMQSPRSIAVPETTALDISCVSPVTVASP